ncbi:MAG TPA: MBL fold metallo-hydrolase, partial [Gaiellaceae bacterium]|nr:MBL fold metallo-hydrolase [Gaiellaceae bacterium]
LHGGRRRVSVPVVPIDLHHQGADRVIGAYLLQTSDGTAIFDCGPASALPALEAGLRERGIGLGDVRHLLLSHIHLDHGGAAGTIVRQHPHVQVHVSAIGAPHLVDPSRLEASARRLYGDAFDPLWGELAPVPEENLHIVGDEVVGLECFPSPGHASHHVCYAHEDGTLYAGDAAGVRIAPSRLVMPPTPPPDVDVPAWYATLDELERRAPERLALVHFGVFDDIERHLGELHSRLRDWEQLVEDGATQDEFVERARAGLGELDDDDLQAVERAMPMWQSYAGLKRWVERVKPTRSPATASA